MGGRERDPSTVQVAVRVRPRTAQEISVGVQEIVSVQGSSCVIMDPTAMAAAETLQLRSKKDTGNLSQFARTFNFDSCFWSANPEDENYASQEHVYNKLGVSILDNAWEGYNCSIFAYGQTGAGKSYTMMGTGTALDDKLKTSDYGLIPRVCCGLFSSMEERVDEKHGSNLHYSVEVSYIEIYNEVVRDLFNPKSKPLKVREHPTNGAYVEDLCLVSVSSYQEIGQLIAYGGKTRTVAATNMNQYSSRSHAIFTITFRQTQVDLEQNSAWEKNSRINLVDLAGSERVTNTGSTGDRLKEANNINRSLATLSDVIKSLATSHKNKKATGREQFVPYRNSVLTWLLKESLGGNAKTIMLAAISPCDVHFDETVSTLRYLERAKHVQNNAVVNQDSSEQLIQQLKAEITLLRGQLAEKDPGESLRAVHFETNDDSLEKQLQVLQEKLAEKELIIQQLISSGDGSLSSHFEYSRKPSIFQQMGVALPGDEIDENTPRLVNLNQDPLFSECLIYYLKEGVTVIGSADDSTIQLSGEDMVPQHCIITHTQGRLMLCPLGPDTPCFVNGKKVGWSSCDEANAVMLSHKSRVVFGRHHFFRLEHPLQGSALLGRTSNGNTIPAVVNWEFAQKELAEKSGLPALFGAQALPHLYSLEEKVRQLEAERQEYKRKLEARMEELSERSSMPVRTWRQSSGGGSDSETSTYSAGKPLLPRFVGSSQEFPPGPESDSSQAECRDQATEQIRNEQRQARLRHRQLRGLQVRQSAESEDPPIPKMLEGVSMGAYTNMSQNWTPPAPPEVETQNSVQDRWYLQKMEQENLDCNVQPLGRPPLMSAIPKNFQSSQSPTDDENFPPRSNAYSPTPSISELSFNTRRLSNGQSQNSLASEGGGSDIEALQDQLNFAQQRIDKLERNLQSIVSNQASRNTPDDASDAGMSTYSIPEPSQQFDQEKAAAKARYVQRQKERAAKIIKAETSKQQQFNHS